MTEAYVDTFTGDSLDDMFFNQIHSFIPRMKGDKSVVERKALYLKMLATYKYHARATKRCPNWVEPDFCTWIREDQHFCDAIWMVRRYNTERLEYIMACKAGMFGEDKKHRFGNFDPNCLGHLIRIGRVNGIPWRLAADGRKGETPKSEGVSGREEGPTILITEEVG